MRDLQRVVEATTKKRKKKDLNVYIVSCGDLIKIGVTNDIDKRVKTLQTGNPFPIVVEFVEQKRQAYKIESYLHRMFEQYRVQGEWFKGITVRDVRAKMLMCHDFD